MRMTRVGDRPSLVLLGVISGAHGIGGDVIIRSFTEAPGSIVSYRNLQNQHGDPVPALRLVRVTDRGVIARVEGIADRTRAEALKGTELWIARAALPAPAAGEFYHADLIGLQALNPQGECVGHIIAVENFGAGDLLEIRVVGTQRTEYVPFTNASVPTISYELGTATVILPELETNDDDADHTIEQNADPENRASKKLP